MKNKCHLFGLLALMCTLPAACSSLIVSPYNNHTYLVSSAPMTYIQARAFAETAGGHLVSFDSVNEEDSIRTLFGRTEIFWTGLEEFKGVYTWDTGEPLTYTHWGANDPSPVLGNAVVFNWPGSRGFTRGEFAQVSGKSVYRAIVEFEPATATPAQ